MTVNLTPSCKLDRIGTLIHREDLTAYQKCIGVGLIVAAGRDGIAHASTADMMRMASVTNRKTVLGATAKLRSEKVIGKLSENGQAGRFSILPPRVVEAVTKAFIELKTRPSERYRSPPGPVPPNGTGHEAEPVPPNNTGIAKANPSDGTGTVQRDGFSAPSRVRVDGITTLPIQLDTLNKITTVEQVERGVQGGNQPDCKPKRALPRSKPTVEQFDRFWSEYPRRKGKPKALERFMALTPEQAERAIAGAKVYADECRAKGTEDRFQKWPQGWLAERRFDDEATPAENDQVGPNGKRWGWWHGIETKLKSLSADYWRNAIREHQPNGTWPWWIFGAPPGHDECLMPADLVAEYGYAEIYKGQITHE